MSKLTHWKKLKNNNYIGAYFLEPNKDIILTIKDVRKETIIGTDGKKEEGTVVAFYENVKPLILNTTNAKTIAKIYDTAYVENWQGKKIQLYSAKIKAFGEFLEALRVRPYQPLVCKSCNANVEKYNNTTAEQLAVYTTSKYGKPLCSNCATKAGKGDLKIEQEEGQSVSDLLENMEEEDNE